MLRSGSKVVPIRQRGCAVMSAKWAQLCFKRPNEEDAVVRIVLLQSWTVAVEEYEEMWKEMAAGAGEKVIDLLVVGYGAHYHREKRTEYREHIEKLAVTLGKGAAANGVTVVIRGTIPQHFPVPGGQYESLKEGFDKRFVPYGSRAVLTPLAHSLTRSLSLSRHLC